MKVESYNYRVSGMHTISLPEGGPGWGQQLETQSKTANTTVDSGRNIKFIIIRRVNRYF